MDILALAPRAGPPPPLATAASCRRPQPPSPGFRKGSAALAGLPLLLKARASRRSSRRRRGAVARKANGVNYWRSLPGEPFEKIDKILMDISNNIVLSELDKQPCRAINLIRLPEDSMPSVGRTVDVTLIGAGQVAAVRDSVANTDGFLGCTVEVAKASTLPRGCVGVEVKNVITLNDSVLVSMRGVCSVRILDRRIICPPDGYYVRLAQEVCEQSEFENTNGGELAVIAEYNRLRELFRICGELQMRTGIWAAGDLYTKTLDELTDVSVANLDDLDLGLSPAMLRATLAAYAAAAALKRKHSTFLCDPCSVLRRLRKLNKFLSLMQNLLSSKAGF